MKADVTVILNLNHCKKTGCGREEVALSGIRPSRYRFDCRKYFLNLAKTGFELPFIVRTASEANKIRLKGNSMQSIWKTCLLSQKIELKRKIHLEI